MDLCIGSLPKELNHAELKKLVETHAQVLNAKIICQEGVSRGFGFITVSDDDAQLVIHRLHGQMLGENKLCVKKAHSKRNLPRQVYISKKWREKALEKV
ncbi:MAG: RNA-binding protein [Chlamydiia bacterium]|nr:RNA-binding protein [Chlamydiia bacterium]